MKIKTKEWEKTFPKHIPDEELVTIIWKELQIAEKKKKRHNKTMKTKMETKLTGDEQKFGQHH